MGASRSTSFLKPTFHQYVAMYVGFDIEKLVLETYWAQTHCQEHTVKDVNKGLVFVCT